MCCYHDSLYPYMFRNLSHWTHEVVELVNLVARESSNKGVAYYGVVEFSTVLTVLVVQYSESDAVAWSSCIGWQYVGVW